MFRSKLLLNWGHPIGKIAAKAVLSSKLSAALVLSAKHPTGRESRDETNVGRSLRVRMALDIGPGWRSDNFSRQLPSHSSAVILADAQSNWNNAAVLDRETGLVWQRTPGSPGVGGIIWEGAQDSCFRAGSPTNPTPPNVPPSRLGWRLPSVEELASLIDPTQTNPALPAGHPFQSVQTPTPYAATYWTATTIPPGHIGNGGFAYAVNFNTGTIDLAPQFDAILGIWCVRGGQGTGAPQAAPN
jgi:hypothetical protein